MRRRFAIFRNYVNSHCEFGTPIKQLEELKSLEKQLKDSLISLITFRNLSHLDEQCYDLHQTPEAVIRESQAVFKFRDNIRKDEEKIKSLSIEYRELKKKIENKEA